MLWFHRGLIFLLFILSSCNSQREEQSDALHIKIPETKEEERIQLNASDVISDIEYVALETLPPCLIGERYKISMSENYIFVYSSSGSSSDISGTFRSGSGISNFYLFSRKGKFIRSRSSQTT